MDERPLLVHDDGAASQVSHEPVVQTLGARAEAQRESRDGQAIHAGQALRRALAVTVDQRRQDGDLLVSGQNVHGVLVED